ncbi:M14 family metallopeptidase [Aestuariirhabdus sp. Z084]|uniref:M14 family metallopeptidase n=1 Tax=Aestuariirhabdus haliotis TaxID=2918751 RepID=UPI00201B403D|nr:M14 family metallopeptidase [Aestuariirhabdus haliotis]MCL6416751.1 M14 family metallopeptidase [Aestuariirhabdus haliotis]MCL6420751.1 M14 family metallopeptidase [Aestuariirhabdus haliotis]
MNAFYQWIITLTGIILMTFSPSGIAASHSDHQAPNFSQQELQSMLPPSPPWDGASTRFIVDPEHLWATPAEASDFQELATYPQLVEWLHRLASASPDIELVSLHQFPSGEHLWLVVASRETDKKPASLKASGKPTLLVQAGIHPGESMGVQAGLMFLRDLSVRDTQRDLLKKANFLFVPVLNVSGYLSQSPHGRINQHGPNTSGNRANNRWLNLNRDFGKLDTQEVRAMVDIMNHWQPDFFVDAHSTNGQNYQYDVTWCDNGASGLSPHQYRWMRKHLQPAMEKKLKKLGHIPGPCIDANDAMKPEAGFYPYLSDGAAYSNNYADHRHLPAYLLEIHSLKPFKQRVLGAYSFYQSLLDTLGKKGMELRAKAKQDRQARIDPVPVTWDYDDPAPQAEFKSFEYQVVKNPSVGIEQIIWSDTVANLQVEKSVRSTPLNPIKRPRAYYIPSSWHEVIRRLKAHGIHTETLTEEVTREVVRYRMTHFEITNPNREGRATANATPVPENHRVTYRKGDVRVNTDQPLGNLAIALLEPTGESSFFYWGFFNSQMTTHAYGANYIVTPYAERMLASDPDLKKAYEEQQAQDPDFIKDSGAVINWFFERMPFYEEEAFLLPIGIEHF